MPHERDSFLSCIVGSRKQVPGKMNLVRKEQAPLNSDVMFVHLKNDRLQTWMIRMLETELLIFLQISLSKPLSSKGEFDTADAFFQLLKKTNLKNQNPSRSSDGETGRREENRSSWLTIDKQMRPDWKISVTCLDPKKS